MVQIMVEKEKEEEEKKEKLSIEEIENLSYYDFMAYLNAPFFNLGGASSIDELAEMCGLSEGQKVLNVGCGTGFNSCYLAKEYGCSIVGVDIAEGMVEKAKERAEKEELTNLVKFEIGDAYGLQFEDNSFDGVITSFVCQFLNLEKAFKEFRRVLKPGGYIAINEMYKADAIPEEPAEIVNRGEEIFQEIIELPFKYYTANDWVKAFENANLKDVQLEEVPYKSIKIRQLIKDIGGYKYMFKTMGAIIKLAWKSKKLRHRFGLLGQAKKVFRNKEAKKYVGYVLVVGKKPKK
jgi:ubiquinone/menaquinone biosynthesis C-methylase UbiE